MSNVHFDRIIVYYSEWQSAYKELRDNIEFHEGLPKNSNFVDDHRLKLIIIDDLMREPSDASGVLPIFLPRAVIIIILVKRNIHHAKSFSQGPT